MSTTVSEIDDYVAAVHAALADLLDSEREDLLDDLPQHLADVQADRSGSLVELLGTPEAYAAELRATAGLDATPGTRPWSQTLRHRLVAADHWVGSALNYDRFVDLLRELAPGWWLVRAYLVVQVGTHAVSRFGSHALVPQVGGSRVAGVVLLVAACAGSVWLGRRGFRREWQRVVSVLLALALVGYGVVLVRQIEKSTTVYVDNGSSDDGTSGITNVYPVGPDGTVLKNVRLYDQDGNPVQLGDSSCPFNASDPGSDSRDENDQDGSTPVPEATTAASNDGANVYPLTCNAGQGPFGSGHAPVLPSASSSASTSPSTLPSTSPSTSPLTPPSVTPSASASATPSAPSPTPSATPTG